MEETAQFNSLQDIINNEEKGIQTNLSRRQIEHAISNLPSEPHQLFCSQIGLRFHIRVFKVSFI